MVNKTDKYLSPTEAALLLNTSANSLRYSEKFKIIPVYKNPVYGTRMYKREDLEKFLNTEVIPLRYEAYETKKRNAAIEKTTEKIIEKPITINKEEIIRAKNIEAQIAEKVQVIEKLEEISKIPTEEARPSPSSRWRSRPARTAPATASCTSPTGSPSRWSW